ncbi:MAG: hypothetical protein R8G33_07445 [Gammaproteobacteria bacterium]|nr:hypothetical protein [Gammaproteobacteria bacterium]
MYKGIARNVIPIFFLFFISLDDVFPHGGVFLEDDQCVIQIGFFKAHFTVYLPQISANKEYCEDLPSAGETLFVLDYLHNSLKQMPVDFRIIKNVTGLGRSTKWEDIVKLNNLHEETIFYQSHTFAQNGSFTVEHRFIDNGQYIGIITTQQQGSEKIYRAVFPFKVGASKIGYLPLFLLLILLVEIYYLYSNGTLQRWCNRLSKR